MNILKNIAVVTGFVFIAFIIILALADFNNLILIMGLIAVIAVISGAVKVLLLREKHRAIKLELHEFRENRLRQMKKTLPKKNQKKPYFCPVCLYQSNTKSNRCPKCKKGVLKRGISTE